MENESVTNSRRRNTVILDDVVLKWSDCDSSSDRLLHPWNEAAILERLTGVSGVPRVLSAHRVEDLEVLVMSRMSGERLGSWDLNLISALWVWLRLSLLVLRVSWRGVSHNDITLDNVLLGGGRICLIDFDQASEASLWQCSRRAFLGRRSSELRIFGSMPSLLKDLLRGCLPSPIIKLVRRLRGQNYWQDVRPGLPPVDQGAPKEIQLLREAWSIAQCSDASSPGALQAYFSFDYRGYHWPGERPWAKRWAILSHVTDYTGKKVVELGCNMGLLGAFLLRYAGAESVVAVDRDPEIIRAAELVGDALGARPDLRVVDLDNDDSWEDSIGVAELVFCLNVLNWVNDRERLEHYLAGFPELVYEGHASPEEELARISRLGFSSVSLVAISERGRPLIHGRK